VPKLSTNFDEILSRPNGKFEEQNEILQSSIIIINYCVITHNYIINIRYK
jgi:hypothetical protein